MPIGQTLNLSGAVPIALLPVRLETRFSTSPSGENVLLIRVYVDDIHRDTHEPALTTEEVTWGKVFWRDTWRAGLADSADANYPQRLAQEQAAWKQLASRFGAARSTYIIQTEFLTPTNPGDRPVAMNLGGTLGAEPMFPAPGSLRKTSWERPAKARCLPDNWLAIGYAGAKQVIERSLNVAGDLSIGPDPSANAPAHPVANGQAPVDPGILWMVDFQEAITKGMAIRMKLPPEVAVSGLDRLVVVGVRSSGATPQAGAEELSRLFDAHRYTWGLSLLAHGTPTNNTDSVRSGYSREDVGFQASFALRGEPVPGAADAGGEIASALGLENKRFQGIAFAAKRTQPGVEDINRALWPATMGYFVEQFFNGLFPTYASGTWCDYFSRYVRAAGSLPGFRTGRQPYGILPVTTLEGWNAASLPPMLPLLKVLRDTWLPAISTIPHAGRRSAESGRDLVDVLGQQPGSQTYTWRWGRGADFIRNFWRLPGQQVDPNLLETNISAAAEQVKQLLLRIGLSPATLPRIAAMTFSDEPEIHDGPLVQDAAFSADTTLKSNYIARLADRSIPIGVVHAEGAALWPDATVPKPLLYRFLRHATLLAYAHQALEDWLLEAPPVGVAARGTAPPWYDLELIDALANPPASNDVSLTPFRTPTFSRVLLEAQIPDPRNPGAQISRGEFLRQTVTAGPSSPLARFLASLQALSALSGSELEKLLRDSLDLVSYRLDAWVTSVANYQLNQCRAQAGGATGIFLGAYGWVEDLRPRTSAGASEGFIHAPTTSHANAAAVLRSGYLAHRGQAEGARLQVDLSSRRVRQALALVDGVRQGQPLGALLGYQLERRLHERRPRLDIYIQPLRALAPIGGSGQVPRVPNEPTDAVSANNVVDGALLLQKFEANPDLFAVDPFRPERVALEAEVRGLKDAIDALGDLSLAEGIYQAVQGNYARASSNLDALSRGEAPTDFGVLHTPRSGIGFTQRLVVLVNAAAGEANGWSMATPRALAAPPLAAWAGYLLGAPQRVKFSVAYFKVGKDPSKDEPDDVKVFSIADLPSLPSALDIVYSPPTSGEVAQGELELRLARLAVWKRDTAKVPADALLRFRLSRDAFGGADSDLTLPELFELARPVRELFTNSRALNAGDLAEAGSVVESSLLLEVFRNSYEGVRALWSSAQTSLTEAIRDLESDAGLDLEAIRDALERLSGFAVQHTVPTAVGTATPQDRAKLLEQAHKVSVQVNSIGNQLPNTPSATLEATAISAALGALFGQGFRFTPAFAVPQGSVYFEAVAKRLAAGDAGSARVAEWMRSASTVREQVRRMRSVQTLAETVTDPFNALGTQVAQLPLSESPWNKLTDASRVGATSIVAQLAYVGNGPSPPTGVVCGLLVDEWVEVVPQKTIDTGVAVHHDSPGSTAPQAMLLAVAPDLNQPWSEDTLVAVVREALDLAKLRMLDYDLLPGMGQFLPATYMASNIGGVPGGDTVSTRLA